MKTIQLIFAVALLCSAFSTQAQFTNNKPNNQCGTAATGTLTFAGSQAIIGWEEGHYDPNNGTFILNNFYGTAAKTFNYSIPVNNSRVYRVRISAVPHQWVGYSPIINAYPQAVAGTLTGNATYIDSGSGTIRLIGNAGGTLSFGANSGLTSQGNGYYAYTNLTQTKTYHATVSNPGCSSTSNSVTVKIYKKGSIIVPATAAMGNRVTASLSGHDAEKIIGWEYSTDAGTTWTFVDHPFPSYRHEIATNTRFRVKLDFGQYGLAYTNPATTTAQEYTVAYPNPIFQYGDTVGNYVREYVVTVANVTNPSAVPNLPPAQKRESATFIDGLGRPAQTKLRKATPDMKDIVGVIDYDRTGRTPKDYLPYVEDGTKFYFRLNYLGEQSAFYNSAINNKIAKSSSAHTYTEFEKSPLGKVIRGYRPGNSNIYRTISYFTNDASEVRLFKSDGTSSGFYPVNELVKVQTSDEQGKKQQTITNKSGQTILTRTQLDETVDGVLVPWLETYYVYYENGALRYIISPKGVQTLKNSSWSFTQAFKNQYVHEFVYDSRGRLIEKKVPGQDWLYYCYDPLDRLVLVQDGNLRPQYKWIYIKYDRKGRVAQQGIYTVPSPSNSSRAAVQSVYVDAFYNGGGNPFSGMPGATFPDSNTEVLVSNYYDGYGPNTGYSVQGLPGENSPGSKVGLLTYSSRKVLGTNNTILSHFNYDKNGRIIQILSNNQFQTATGDLTTFVYDFEGKATYKKVTKTVNGNATTVLNRYAYDHMGRLTHVYQKNNNASTEQLVAQYEYNGLGQLVDKKLHNTSGSAFLQSVDYRYTIQGQLASINNAQLNVNTANNDETNDYFGMEFLYNTVESGLNNTNYYNGDLSAVKWKGAGAASGTEDQKSYKYTYDKAGRLKTATSQMRTGSAWTKEANVFNENTTYDLNGNILTLQRNQRKHQLAGVTASYVSEAIDNLIYSYNSSMGDQLIKVEDTANNPAGFANGTNQATEYFYNTSGSLTEDRNKGISSVVYNILGKPSEINFTDGRKVEYTYDVSGNKLTMKTYQGTTLQSTTDYVDEFVYENGQLSFFGSPEGRVVKNASGNLEYQYAIADHQGNTRVVFTSVNPVQPITATFEGNSGDQASQFTNVNTSNVVTFTAANHTPSGSKVVRMNQTYKIGPSKSLKVFPGDKVDLEVWEYHEGASGFGTSSTPLTTLITMVSGAFGGVSGGVGESGFIYDGVNSAVNTFLPPGNQGSNRPAAYLNYILFDKNYKVLDMGWKPAPATTFTKQKLSFSTIDIKEAGYIFVYLSYDNASNNWVYFDDLKITHTKTNVIQYNEYYPFGLQANTSWTRENSKNDFLYNAGSELNTTSGWYETFYRNYDPALGRFTSIDPLATKYASYSGYHYSGNNPVMLNDPTGAYWNGYEEVEWTGGPSGCNCNWMYSDMSNQNWIAATRPGGPNVFDHMRWEWDAQKQAIQSQQSSGGFKTKEDVNAYIDLLLQGTLLPEVTITDMKIGNYPLWWGQMDWFIRGEGSNQGNGPSPGYEFVSAFGFATNVAELYRQGYGAVRFGTTLQNTEKLLKEGKFINYNGKVYSNKFFGNQYVNSKTIAASKDAFAKSASTFKLAGKAMTGVGIAVAGYQFLASDQSGGDWARLGGSAIITGTAFIPVVGPFISIGLGIADSYGAFDGIYDYFDKP